MARAPRVALRALLLLVLLLPARARAALPDGGGGPPDAQVPIGDGGVIVVGSGLQVSPNPIDFGTVPVGMLQSRSAQLVNTEVALAITVSAFTRPGTTDCAPFTVAPDQPLPELLAGGDLRTWSVSFKPVVAGTYDCTIQITDTDGDTDVIHALGQAGAPQLTVTPPTIAFGNVATGAFVDQTVTLSNDGTSPLSISAIALMPSAPPFTLQGAPIVFPVVLGPTESVSFAVRFSPTAESGFAAALVIDSDDPTTPMRMVGVTGTGVAPGGGVLTLAPDPVAFGPIAVGASGGATLTLGNSGAAALTVTGLAISGVDAADFQFTDPADGCVGGQACPATFAIAATASHPVPLRCAPSASGTRLATLTVTTTATGTKAVTLACAATAAGITVSPPSMQFGTIRVNTGTSQALSIGNSGNVDLHVTGIAIAGTAAGDYGAAGCALGCTIPANTSQIVNVTFTPTARGDRPAALHIASDDPGQPDTVVALDGAGGAGVLAITVPASGDLDFGQIPVGATSSPASVTIQNQGELSLTISAADAAPAIFARAGQAPPLTLAPGALATWPLTCHPTAAATVDGALTITSDALASAVQSVALHCTGTTSSLVASPSPLGFGGVRTDRTATLPITLTNTGAVAVTIDRVVASSPAYTPTPVGTLPRTLGQNQTLTVNVLFAPTAEQAYPATLAFQDGAAVALAAVALSGDGHVPLFSVAPLTIDYGPHCVGQSDARDAIVRNDGTAAIRITSTAIAGAGFSISSGDVGGGLDLAPTQAHAITIVGVAASGTRTGMLTVTTDLTTAGTRSVALSIDGTTTGVVASPAALVFGPEQVGATSAAQDVQITNCDAAPLAIASVAITGVDATAFAVTGPAAPSIPVGGNATWAVTFTPGAVGAQHAALAFTSSGAPIAVPLAGTGYEGDAGFVDDGGVRPPDAGAGTDTTSYYACACRAPGAPGAAAPLVLAVAFVLRRRRRR